MESSPPSKHDTARRSECFKELGARLLLAGGVAAVVGGALMVTSVQGLEAIGAILASLAAAPTALGLALFVIGLTGSRVSQEKPLA